MEAKEGGKRLLGRAVVATLLLCWFCNRPQVCELYACAILADACFGVFAAGLRYSSMSDLHDFSITGHRLSTPEDDKTAWK